MRGFFLALIVIFSCSSAWAQALSDKTVDKKFVIVNGFMVGATIFDVETTFRGLENCSNCKELNPLMRPFVNSGRPATYAVETGVNTAIIYYSYRLKENGSKLWWAIPFAVGAVHSVAGSANLRFSTKFTF